MMMIQMQQDQLDSTRVEIETGHLAALVTTWIMMLQTTIPHQINLSSL